MNIDGISYVDPTSILRTTKKIEENKKNVRIMTNV
jgi:hypothetical protein